MVSKQVAIVAGSFHHEYIDQMITAATRKAQELSVKIVQIVRVPGSYEKPLAVKRLLMRTDVDAVVVLGIIERGETSHGLVMGQSVSNTLISLQLEFVKPVGIGILGPGVQPEQIGSRLEKYAVSAVEAAVFMLREGAE